MADSPIPIGAAVVASGGEMLGYVGALYNDNATGTPAWASVTGRDHTAVVPLERSRFDGRVLRIPYNADQVATAPHRDPTALISYPDGDDLALHYGLIPAPRDDTTSAPDHGDIGESVRPGAMTLSQEQARVGVVNVAVGRARLVTSIVTEQQTFTIPVSRQEVRLVIDPLPANEQFTTDTRPAEETYEVIRLAEQVLFTKQVVPVERVRMVKRVVTTDLAVTSELRSEQLDLTDIGAPTAGDGDGGTEKRT